MQNCFSLCKPCEIEILSSLNKETVADSETEMGTGSMTTASQNELVGFLQDKDLSKSIKASCGGTCLSSWYFKGSRMGV